jgi:hypothetical protein
MSRCIPKTLDLHLKNSDLLLLEIFLAQTIFSGAAPVAASRSARLPLRGRNSLLTMWLWRRGRDADVVSAGSTHLEEIE